MNRNCKGQFVPGNSIARKGGLARARALPAERRRAIARQGWDALVRKHFEGDQAAARRWWGEIGAWASDVAAGYAGTWMQAFHHPGPPHEFLERYEHEQRYALDFTLDELGELAF